MLREEPQKTRRNPLQLTSHAEIHECNWDSRKSGCLLSFAGLIDLCGFMVDGKPNLTCTTLKSSSGCSCRQLSDCNGNRFQNKLKLVQTGFELGICGNNDVPGAQDFLAVLYPKLQILGKFLVELQQQAWW